ncbi:Tail fiber [Quillaja saponaria]|uniref:Tail fiber n=1 Tax=Quillaja saponaria TaxID=32244 RepID=A0AAD7LIZ6_QUISA|nr:Tail fiber [Quillaja saponaria]
MATSSISSSSSSKGWVKNLWSTASRIYFFLIILQIPLFRVPCRAGMCTTPLHVTSSQLIASEIFPVAVIKTLLYPGAFANGIIKNMTVPSWDNLLDIYNLTQVKEASPVTDLQRLEVLAGSYFSVAGALLGLLKPGRMSMFGTLLIIWGRRQGRDFRKTSKYRSLRSCLCLSNNGDCPYMCLLICEV